MRQYKDKELNTMFNDYEKEFQHIRENPDSIFDSDLMFFMNAFVKELRLYGFEDEKIEKLIERSSFYVEDGAVSRDDLLVSAGNLAKIGSEIEEMSYGYHGTLDPILINSFVAYAPTFQIFRDSKTNDGEYEE